MRMKASSAGAAHLHQARMAHMFVIAPANGGDDTGPVHHASHISAYPLSPRSSFYLIHQWRQSSERLVWHSSALPPPPRRAGTAGGGAHQQKFLPSRRPRMATPNLHLNLCFSASLQSTTHYWPLFAGPVLVPQSSYSLPPIVALLRLANAVLLVLPSFFLSF